MGVKLQFGQQVAAGDAKKRAGAKRQSTAEKGCVGTGKLTRAEIEQSGADRAHQRKSPFKTCRDNRELPPTVIKVEMAIASKSKTTPRSEAAAADLPS